MKTTSARSIMCCLAALLLCLVIGAAAGSPAAAQPAEKAATTDVQESAATTVAEFERVMKDGGCNPKAISDPAFLADAKNAIRPLIHAEDAKAMMTDRRHVVLAYAAILVLLVGFLVFLYVRQSRLSAEIARLEDELRRAMDEG